MKMAEDSKKTLALKVIVAVCFILMLILWQVSRRVGQFDFYSMDFMDTVSHVMVIAKNQVAGQRAGDSAFEMLEKNQSVMNYYDADSELGQLNFKASDGEVKVSRELFDLIESCGEFYELSGGAYDITIGPLADLWKNPNGNKPTQKQLDDAKVKVGYDKLILDKEKLTVKFSVKGMKIDLGSVAKGYSIDLAIEAMKKSGAKGGLVDVGGDIACFGVTKKGEGCFKVGLQNPAGVEDVNNPQLLQILKLKDCAVATSGNYRRALEIGNEKFSHIVDPLTEKSVTKFSSTTAIAPTAMRADALATVLSLVSLQKGREIIESLKDTEAVWVESETGKVFVSGGIEKYLD